MDVWHCSSKDQLHALTSEADGSNLPEDLGPGI